MVVDGSEAGHCFHLLLFVHGGLRAPHVVADGSEAGYCFHLLFSSSVRREAKIEHPEVAPVVSNMFVVSW